MFKKFSAAEDVGTRNVMKSSTQRNIRKAIVDSFPGIAPVIDAIVAKKAQGTLVKW